MSTRYITEAAIAEALMAYLGRGLTVMDGLTVTTTPAVVARLATCGRGVRSVLGVPIVADRRCPPETCFIAKAQP